MAILLSKANIVETSQLIKIKTGGNKYIFFGSLISLFVNNSFLRSNNSHNQTNPKKANLVR